MKKKTKERVQLSQESINKILNLVSTRMKPEAKFAFDSRGMEVFVQNTDQIAFEDKHTKREVECVIRKCDPDFSLEEIIAAEIISDVSVMALRSDYAAYTKYSYSLYDETDAASLPTDVAMDMKASLRGALKLIRYAKSIA